MKNKSADGLRGVAAFNVVTAHFIAAFLPTLLHRNYPSLFPVEAAPGSLFQILAFPLTTIFYNGHFPVLLFFALSGYVLTLPYFADDQAGPILQQRVWGRYLRLNIPIAAAILLSYAVYRLGLYANVQAASVSGSVHWLATFYPDGISAVTMVREALYESIVMGKGTFIPPLWTLRVEFIGSLYILAFCLLKPRGRTALPMLFVFLLLYAVYQQESIYFNVIFAGAMLNVVRPGGKTLLIMAVAGVYFGCFQFESPAYDFLPPLQFAGVQLWEKKDFYNAVGAVLLAAAVTQGFGKSLLEHRLIQFLGRISFPLYLLHFIVLCSLGCRMYLYFPRSPLYLAFEFVVYVAACVLAAGIFERYVDKSAIRLAHRITSRLFRTQSPQDQAVQLRAKPDRVA
ncbi:MAG: acyltransferase [Telluria sp.]